MPCFSRVLARRVALLPLCCALAAAGCGPGRPKTLPVTGVVTLDGKPLEEASVLFAPEGGGRPATGLTDKEGRFRLGTFVPGDGALPGKHLVSVVKKKTSGVLTDADGLSGGVAPGGIVEHWFTPKRYADPKTSGLTAEVQPGMDPLRLELSSP